MTLLAAVGQARDLDGREAGSQAARQAMDKLGSNSPILGIIISSSTYDAQQVVSGVAGLIGNTPVIGFSSPAGLTSDGLHSHSVVVALLAAGDVRADVQWLSGLTRDGGEVSQQLVDLLKRKRKQPALLFADGFNADAEQLCKSLPAGVNLVGALSSGDQQTGNVYQISGPRSGSNGLALARLEGRIRVGVGYGHGWQPVGTKFRITSAHGFRVDALDGRPASETYAQLFGYPPGEWTIPPLNNLARLYPLGLEQPDKSLLLRSPLCVDADGSFRMNAAIPDGSEACLLTGSLSTCRAAAQAAAGQALAALEGSRPVLALVLADIAWLMLFKAQPGGEMAAVQATLGLDVPLAGGYTLGQIVPSDNGIPRFLNQHMVVMVFGEPREKEKKN
jgi:hypothetical protein